ncbi:uncharacterized protein LOC122088969 [Macadamia integrifolia]|uniref:uncharacterized protein LOC122088969 n=1 Tax=Macadamia integrifolia TaxID=60698 RepID=UPI001C4E85A2|nr:uncharacterized protein LOC122088969 [Macadamia integrifolia]
MAISSNSNRSPSPNSSRTNPNSRTQESTCIRKSFSGDPFTRPSIVAYPRSFNPVTPANSPADFSQRNSGHREGSASLRIPDKQKEDEKDQNLKPARVRSPVVSTGTKSFMAPTISAASKINPAPRRKVLTERNEAVRTSFSAGKSPFTATNPSETAEEVSSKLETIFNSKVHPESPKKSDATLVSPAPVVLKNDAIAEEVSSKLETIFNSKVHPETPKKSDATLVSPAPVVLKNDANRKSEIFNSEVTTETPDLLLISPENREVKPSLSPSPVLAPLEVDPSLPPYDPKTNYLSPRPQFLRYKPNPRIDDYLNKEQGFDTGEGKQLLELFSSESSSETEITEESQSHNPKNEYEDVGSSEMASEEENENHFFEHELDTSQNRNEELLINESRKLHFGRSKSIPLLLILVVVCLCFPVTDTPMNYPSLFKSQTFRFDSPAKITELAKTKFDGLSHDVMLWSVNSVSYLSKLISTSNRLEQIVPLEFVNSTSLDGEYLADQSRTVDDGDNHTEKWQVDKTMKSVEEEIAEIQTNVEFEEQPQVEFLDKGDFVSYTNNEPTSAEVAEKCSNIEIEVQPLLPQVFDVESDISEADSLGENDTDLFTNIEPTNAEAMTKSTDSDFLHGSSHGLEPPESSLQGSTYRFPVQNVLGISSVLLALLVAPLLFLKQNKASAPKVAVPVEQLVAKKKSSLCSVSASSGHLNQEMTPLPLWPAEVEKVGESCPSEMSSSLQVSLNCGKKKASDRANEVQSHERKPRRSAKRESLASSSEFSAESPSYGSFTTYEKFQSKHVSGDEGAVTPVRRSSRIRNQITSP